MMEYKSFTVRYGHVTVIAVHQMEHVSNKHKIPRKCPVCKARFFVSNRKSKRMYDKAACKQLAYRERVTKLVEAGRKALGG
jgi:ribosomal protein L37AE/L43A